MLLKNPGEPADGDFFIQQGKRDGYADRIIQSGSGVGHSNPFQCRRALVRDQDHQE